jgi:CheY-like chemotaxis protein
MVRTTEASRQGIEGLRVLVVEDSPVVAPYVHDLLTDLGCMVIGPAINMASARELAQEEQFDVAVVDLHIRGDKVFPVCELLAARGVPFIITSGYADWTMPDKWQDRPRLTKPYTIATLQNALEELVAAR